MAPAQQVIDTRRMLKMMFDCYALIGNRMTVDSIQSQKYHRIMRDAAVYGQSSNYGTQGGTILNTSDKEMKKRMDLIFCQINRNKTNMDFEHFLQSLVKVAEAKFPQVHPSQGLKALMDYHMLPLAARTIQSQETHQPVSKSAIPQQLEASLSPGVQFEYDELVSILLRDVGKVLLGIYQIYFEHECKTSTVHSDAIVVKQS